MKNIPVIIIAITLIASLFFLSRTGIYIKQVGGAESGGKISNTISVSGDGKVYAKPDMADVALNFSELAPTSKDALDKVNQKINQAIAVAKQNGIQDNDISTTGLSLYTEYDYSNNVRKIIGQRATQSLDIKVKKIDDKASKAAKLIDDLSTIENIQFNGISFDIEDKTPFFTQARELAYKKAEQKAQELAKLSNVKLLKPVTISDNSYDVSPRPVYANTAMMDSFGKGAGSNTELPTGEMGISSNLSILWGID